MYDIGAGWLAVTMDFLRHSFLFSALRAFLLVYVVVLFIDIILLLVNRGVSGDLRATLHGTDRPLISRNQMIVRWEKIRERVCMETNNKIILMIHTINQVIYSYTSQLLMIKVTTLTII